MHAPYHYMITYHVFRTHRMHWNGNTILLKFLSAAALEVAKMTTFGAANDKISVLVSACILQLQFIAWS